MGVSVSLRLLTSSNEVCNTAVGLMVSEKKISKVFPITGLWELCMGGHRFFLLTDHEHDDLYIFSIPF